MRSQNKKNLVKIILLILTDKMQNKIFLPITTRYISNLENGDFFFIPYNEYSVRIWSSNTLAIILRTLFPKSLLPTNNDNLLT